MNSAHCSVPASYGDQFSAKEVGFANHWESDAGLKIHRDKYLTRIRFYRRFTVGMALHNQYWAQELRSNNKPVVTTLLPEIPTTDYFGKFW